MASNLRCSFLWQFSELQNDLQDVGCGYMDCIGLAQGGGRLWVRKWTFGFREMRGISWLAANQVAAQEGLCTME